MRLPEEAAAASSNMWLAVIVCRPSRLWLLAGLHSLDLSGNRFDCLPPALSTATALTHLTLNGCHLMQLTEADTAVLLALPRLQRLEIEGIRSAEPALIQQWQLRMPNLRIVPMPA